MSSSGMDASEITFFSRKRSSSISTPAQPSDDAILNAEVPALPPELQFGSQLSAFQSMEANDEEVLEIIRSVGPSTRETPTANSSSHMETWASFQSYGPRCQRCGNPCGDDVVYFESVAFHKRHFTCRRCNQPLTQPVLIGGDVFCSTCAQRESTVGQQTADTGCVVCHAPYGPESVLIAGKCYCKNHILCTVCHKKLGTDEFRVRAGQIYCLEHTPTHSPLLCAQCGGEITEKSVLAMGQRYHPQCFYCQLCNNNLANKPFAVWKGRPLCQACFKKLPKHIRVAISKQAMRGGM